MPSDFDTDFRGQAVFLPHMMEIAAAHIRPVISVAVAEADPDDDMQRNTDLDLVLTGEARVSCRVRFQSYYDDFTIRSKRRSGLPTELDKIRDGWGDYLLYGWADRGTNRLKQWFIGDLAVFRKDEPVPFLRDKWNWDGRSAFNAYRFENLPDGFVIASHMSASVPNLLELP